MRIEALPFVNWIFWAGLTSGTLLVVGLTERRGGTTRGYRLFMAWMLAVFAVVLLVSELALPLGVEAAATVDVRRPLTIAFVIGCAAYLVASISEWPRSWLAVATGLVGLAALIVLAAAGGSRSAPLFAGQLVLGALALGAVNAAMLLGHWYLVTPQLSPAPLRRMMWMLGAVLGIQGVAFTVAVIGMGSALEGLGWLAWLRLGVGILLPLLVTALALMASRAPS
ncbi:MAG: hypothetical protein ABIO99_09945, partial [Candidatus Limnocylindria bacterium]